MATVTWKGDAPAVAQVTQWVFAGTWEANDIVKVTIGNKTISIVTGSTTIATLLATVAAALNASTIPEFAEITWSVSSPNLIATGDTAGVPFSVTVSTTETGGGAADSQTIDGATTSTGTDSTACSGPWHWDTDANWSGNAKPVNSDDVVLTNSSNSIYYGLAQTAVTLTSLTIDASFTGTIGLPRTHGSGSSAYTEYRATFLAIKATTVTIGNGPGTGSGRIKLDTSSAQTALTVNRTGQTAEAGMKSITWKGTHASNVVNLNRGSFAAAYYEGETATIATLRVGYYDNPPSDVDAYLGAGVTLTTITKTGGSLVVNSSFTTLNQGPGNAGTTIIQGGTPGTLNITGGTVDHRTTSTTTAANVYAPGVLDCSKDNRTKTFTNATFYPGSTFLDPNETVSFSNPFTIVGTLKDKTLDLGANFTLQRA